MSPPPGGTPPRVHAFIDGQNLYLGVRELGWRLNYRRLRIWLTGKWQVSDAYLFIGYLPSNQRLFDHLERAGYHLVFKELDLGTPHPKGNLDVDLTLHAVTTMSRYDRAVLITSDGDFAPLVRFLKGQGKFETVVSPSAAKCSRLLKRAAGKRIAYLEDVRAKVERRTK
jgi:uncharacterized LabA/DUF88 family protein